MSNRLKPRQQTRPRHPWRVSTRQTGDGRPTEPAPGETDFGEGVVYDPMADRLTLETAPGCTVAISPGRRLAETLGKGFTALPAAAPHKRETATCQECGATIIHADTRNTLGHVVDLDPEPDPNGVWLLQGERGARILRPGETPPSPTYRQHRCPAERSDE